MFSRFFGIKIKTKPEIKHTHYFFGEMPEIEDAELVLLEKNWRGDCLCLAPSSKGLVDVDHRDITNQKETQQ
jgi:hypothetical protein